MNKKKSISFYIIWLIIFMLLMAAVITVGVYVAKRDAPRDAERKYEFNVIQSIIKDVALYQEEIENWGYQVSAVMPDEEIGRAHV